MKPFLVLALCCSFLSSRANPLPFEFLDCDDPDVFKAVDTALKEYNGERTSGNQFALYTVMEAKRTVGPVTQFHVIYRIRETTCATEENKLWQDCDYKASAEAQIGECVAQVHLNDAEKTSNVSQDCKISPATPKITLTEGICLGCFHPVSSDSSEVSEILKQAIKKFNSHSAESALFKLVEIKEATRQVVAGWNYIIKYEVEETNCSKDQFQDLTPECKTTSRGHIGKCDAKAYVNLQEQIVDIANQCKLPVQETVNPDVRTGCVKTIPTDSPELKELLKLSMEKYNSESNDDHYYKSGDIEAAAVQVVAGKIYHLQFAVRKTNCSKKEFEKLEEDCKFTSDSAPLPCEAQIHVIPWENKILPQVNCSIERSAAVLLRRPPGFTPFRSFVAVGQPNEISCSDQNEKEVQRPVEETGKDGGQEPEDETLLSSTDETASQLVNPGAPVEETSSPAEPLILPDTSFSNGSPNRPESPLPKCPGKPWKQIMDSPAPASFPREYADEDLLVSSSKNIDPATENLTPPQTKAKALDLSDALL
ncbi:kininogen-1 [Patagioenas fasciata monilis]|uniref:Kininogen-1 n=1 Tax=Patagioenas fasciata monilis TaxID=372326 RepID=A0A1V4K3L0_PATFA|nr:kininogen-1 [Patagioenas fasciata monilis]